MTLLEWFRETALSASIPTDRFLRQVTTVLRYRLEEVLQQICATNSDVNLAVDGRSDPRVRRSEGVTVRLLRGTETTTALLARKEIKAVHESAQELRIIVGWIQERCGIRDGILNISGDGSAMNESAFRTWLSPQELFTGGVWLPYTCHIPNNLPVQFLENISEPVCPIFRLQHKFRKHAPY
jgi:hypothetical protein